jgi:hypothetical protein
MCDVDVGFADETRGRVVQRQSFYRFASKNQHISIAVFQKRIINNEKTG